MTLMPVSNISVLRSSWSNGGGWRWIGQRSVISSDDSVDVERLAEGVEDVALGHVADRHRDRRAGVAHRGAADQAVGRLHRDGADHVVADVLGDLEGQRACAPRSVAEVDVDVQRVVDLGHRVGGELDVDDRADDADDPADAGASVVGRLRSRWWQSCVLTHSPPLRRARRRRRRSR